jgi:pilus assembly protein CpaE
MSQAIKALVAVEPGVDHDIVQASLPADPGIEIVGVIEGLDESWSVLQETVIDLLVVASREHSDRVLYLVDGAVKQNSARPVVVLYAGTPDGFVRSAFEAGADDVLTLPEMPERVLFALQKAVARKQGAATGTGVAAAPLLCVLGPKGGAGKTVTACNLAVSLATSGRKVVLVDLDLQFGDVALSLGISPEKTIADLATSGGSLDADKVEGYLTRHSSGADLLVAPTRPDQAGVVTVEFLREVYAALRSTHEFVVVDTPPSFTPEVIATIDVSSDLCVVGMLDSLSLKNTKLALETLELMGYRDDRVRLVLNRAGSRVGITEDDVVAIIGRRPDALVPSDRAIPRSVNEGMPITLLDDRSDAASAFRSLAALYLAEPSSPNGNRRRRLLGRSK